MCNVGFISSTVPCIPARLFDATAKLSTCRFRVTVRLRTVPAWGTTTAEFGSDRYFFFKASAFWVWDSKVSG